MESTTVVASIGGWLWMLGIIGGVALIAAIISDSRPKRRQHTVVHVSEPPSTDWAEIIAGLFGALFVGALIFVALPYLIGAVLIFLGLVVVGLILQGSWPRVAAESTPASTISLENEGRTSCPMM